jgi:hypothetical protein
MQIVPLEAAHLFYLNAAILGWLLAAVQPKKQLPRHNSVFEQELYCTAVPLTELSATLSGAQLLKERSWLY